MSQRTVIIAGHRAAWMAFAATTVLLCSCKGAPWSAALDGPPASAADSRFVTKENANRSVPITASIGDIPQHRIALASAQQVPAPVPDAGVNTQGPLPVAFGPSTSYQVAAAAHDAPPLPKSAYQGVSYEVIPCGREECVGCESCRAARGHRHCDTPLPYPGADPNYIPDCTRMPDEYICDGGDREVNVSVLADWTVRGLDSEDTIAHFDTLQGETIVEESNRVCIYAPRFAAVRTVKGMAGHQQMENPLAARDRMVPHQDDTDLIVTTSVQHQQPLGKLGLKPVTIYEQRDIGARLEKTLIVAGLTQGFMPHEDFRLIRFGEWDSAEKPRLAAMVDNAIAWTGDASVKVAIDGKLPVEASNNFAAEQLYVYDFGESRLRIVKTASKQNARPGEIVDFTLRFDNIGDQTIGNVTVIDSLTTRLEYVEGSVQSSVAADFYTQQNEADSLVLRFEVAEPVKVGQGGVIRFQARVR